jgi:formate hydrogenlyase transcriptional activator
MKVPNLDRLNIGARLIVCFVVIILLMLAGNGLLLWQFHVIRTQEARVRSVNQELMAVLRFQTDLLSFHGQLDELAQSENIDRLKKEAEPLGSVLRTAAERTRDLLTHLPAEAHLDPTLLPTLEAIESALPSQLEAITTLAATDDWQAVRLRLANEKKPLESQASALVKNIDREVSQEQAQTAVNIEMSERRLPLIVLTTSSLTLLIAAVLGFVITHSIALPLHHLMEGSRALARGEFGHQISVKGEDELAHLGTVFNDTAGKLRDVYENLRGREEQLRESEKELRQVIEFVPAHVFVVRPDGRGIYANRAILEYYGFTLEEWLAEGVPNRVVHPEDLERYVNARQKGLAGSAPFEMDVRRRRKDGQYRWFLCRFNPMQDEKGNALRWYVAQTDVEEGKQAAQRAHNENLALREEVVRSSMFEEIVGSSDKLIRVLSDVARVAPADSTVLILGETGTGKELIARAVHKQSHRAGRAFIRVNCASIPQSLISSELFGYEKGAFTGAFQRRAGRFEVADGGTIFLDEIGELPAETQVSLLRVLQEREFERLGSSQPISVDVRVLAATNRDLEAAVAGGSFRSDLFYRLNVFPIQLPSLRERSDDIPLLVEYLIERFAKKAGKRIRTIQKKTLELFQAYEWPGNIRELQNVVERAVLLSDGDTFSVDEKWLKQGARGNARATGVSVRRLGKLEASQERELIEAALVASSGKISGPLGAAAKLGIPRQTLESKIASLGIKKSKFQTG